MCRKIRPISLSGEIFENGIAPNFGERKTIRQNTRSISRRLSLESRATCVFRPFSYFSSKLEAKRSLKKELMTSTVLCLFLSYRSCFNFRNGCYGDQSDGRSRRDWAVKYLPYRVLKQICTTLNIKNQFFDEFRMVAEQLGTDKDTIEWIRQSENTTHKIFILSPRCQSGQAD